MAAATDGGATVVWQRMCSSNDLQALTLAPDGTVSAAVAVTSDAVQQWTLRVAADGEAAVGWNGPGGQWLAFRDAPSGAFLAPQQLDADADGALELGADANAEFLVAASQYDPQGHAAPYDERGASGPRLSTAPRRLDTDQLTEIFAASPAGPGAILGCDCGEDAGVDLRALSPDGTFGPLSEALPSQGELLALSIDRSGDALGPLALARPGHAPARAARRLPYSRRWRLEPGRDGVGRRPEHARRLARQRRRRRCGGDVDARGRRRSLPPAGRLLDHRRPATPTPTPTPVAVPRSPPR